MAQKKSADSSNNLLAEAAEESKETDKEEKNPGKLKSQ